MQGLRSTSALCWAPEKVGVRKPLRILSPCLGTPENAGVTQGYVAAKSLAALAGKVRLAVAGKFPIIPKGYSGLVEQLLAE